MFPTESAQRAFDLIRDGSRFQWHVIPLLLLVLYVYANEIVNGLVFSYTNYAPMWATPQGSAYTIFIGLNLEISLMFSIMGIVVAKTLPADPRTRILGMPNRWFVALSASLFCLLIEIWLNAIGQLTWDYWWWSAKRPYLIFLFGYLWFFAFAFWVHDMPSVRRKAVTVLSVAGIDLALIALFSSRL